MAAQALLPFFLLLSLMVGDGYLGVELNQDGGARVARVVPGTAAAQAGFKAGDLIVAVGDREVETVDQLIDAVQKYNAGDRVRFVLQRGERRMTKNVRLGRRGGEGAEREGAEREGAERKGAERKGAERKAGREKAESEAAKGRERAERAKRDERLRPRRAAPRDAAGGKPDLGVQVEDGEDGVKISRVVDGSPAAKSGMKAGDVLLRLGRTRTQDLGRLERALGQLKPGQRVLAVVGRGGEEENLRLVLGAAPTAGGAARTAEPVAPRGLDSARRAAMAKAEKARKEALAKAAKARKSAQAQRSAALKKAAEARRAAVKRAPKEGAKKDDAAGDMRSLRNEIRQLRNEIRQLRGLVDRLLRDRK